MRPDAETYPAFFVSLPRVSRGAGPVMTTVHLVPVFYPSDPLHDQILDALAQLANAEEWYVLAFEYGVGQLVIDAPVELPGPAPSSISDAQIQTFVKTQWSGIDATTRATTLYAVFYPVTTNVTAYGGASCVDFAAYHNTTIPGGAGYIYAVMPHCLSRPTIDLEFPVISHEIFEAATDPQLNGWNGIRESDAEWYLAFNGSEIADLCQVLDSSNFRPPDMSYVIQRSWSNRNAAAFKDPCAPVPFGQGPYFNAVPDTPDMVTLERGGGFTTVMNGVKIKLGTQRTISVRLASNGPTPPWTLDVFPVRGDPLALSLDRTTGGNGDTLQLTITPSAIPPGNVALYAIESHLGDQEAIWPGAVEVTP